MVRIPAHREPTHPGEMLSEEFLKPLGISQRHLADAILVPYRQVNELVNRRRGITASTALRLSYYFGNSPEFWISLQNGWDLFHVMRDEVKELKRIRPLRSES